MIGKTAVLRRIRDRGTALKAVLSQGETLESCWIRAILTSDLLEFFYQSGLPDPPHRTLSRTVSTILDLPIVEPHDEIKMRLGRLILRIEELREGDPTRLELESDLLDLVGSIYEIEDADFGVIDDFMAEFRSTRLSRNKPKWLRLCTGTPDRAKNTE